jgi:hypothetical protein
VPIAQAAACLDRITHKEPGRPRRSGSGRGEFPSSTTSTANTPSRLCSRDRQSRLRSAVHRELQVTGALMNFGPTELLIVLAIVLMLFGSSRLPGPLSVLRRRN